MSITTCRYRAMRADDGWRIWDGSERRWSEVMDRDRARKMARLLGEAPGRDVHVRWELKQPQAVAS